MRQRAAELCAWTGLAALFATLKVCEYLSFHVDDFDTGIYTNLAWNIAHGKGFYSDILAAQHLGEHFSPIVAAFAPLYAIAPSALWLLVAQALAVAVAFPVLLRVFERIAADAPPAAARWIPPACTALFLLYRPMWSALYHDFHPSTLGMPLVAGALLCLHRRADRSLWVLVALLLTTKEVAVAATAGLAIYAAVVVRRPRLALGLAIAAVAAGLAVFAGFMPAFRDGSWGHLARLDPLSDPAGKLAYLVRLALPLGGLPLLGPQALLAAAPTTLVNLAVAYEPQFSLRYHYDDQNCVFWIVAAAHGARWLAVRTCWREAAARRAAAWAVPAAVFALAIALAGPSPIRRLAQWWPTPEQRALANAVRALAALPEEVAVAAQSTLGPRLSHRRRYRTLRDGSLAAAVFEPGECIVLAPALGGFGLDVDAARSSLARDPRAELVGRGGGIEVYQWLAPGEGPAAADSQCSVRLAPRSATSRSRSPADASPAGATAR